MIMDSYDKCLKIICKDIVNLFLAVPTNIPSLLASGLKRQGSTNQGAADNEDETDLDPSAPDGGVSTEGSTDVDLPVQSAEYQSVIRLLEEGEQVCLPADLVYSIHCLNLVYLKF